MSIPVALADLESALANRPLFYLASTDGTRVKVAQVTPLMIAGLVCVSVGAGTLRNVADHPTVVLVAPPPLHDEQAFTLLVDGLVDHIEGQRLAIKPHSAVMHRQASS